MSKALWKLALPQEAQWDMTMYKLRCIITFFQRVSKGECRIRRTMYQRKADMDMLNAVKSVLADASSVSPSPQSKELRQCGIALIAVFFSNYPR